MFENSSIHCKFSLVESIQFSHHTSYDLKYLAKSKSSIISRRKYLENSELISKQPTDKSIVSFSYPILFNA